MTAAAIASCGKRAITISDDGTARCWVRSTGRTPVVAYQPESVCNCARADEFACVRQSRCQLSAAACALQDLVSGACRAVLRLGGVPSAVRLSGDDSLCVVVTGEQAAVYDFGTARQAARLTGHASAITDAAVSGDAASVLTVGEDATLRLWSAQTGAPWLLVQRHLCCLICGEPWPAMLLLACAGQTTRPVVTLRLCTAGEVRALFVADTGLSCCAISQVGSRTVLIAGADNGRHAAVLLANVLIQMIATCQVIHARAVVTLVSDS